MADQAASPAFDSEAISALLKKAAASGGQFNFAFGLGSQPQKCGLMLDLRKPGQALKTQLKQAGDDLKKICFGTLTVVDGDVLLQPLRPLKGMIKQLKRRFRDEGLLRFTPVLVDASGVPVDEDTLPDDDEGDVADGTVPADADAGGQPAGFDHEAVKQRLVAVKGRIEALPRDAIGPILDGFKLAVAQLRAGDPTVVETLDGLEQAIDEFAARPVQPATAGDAAAKITAALTGLVPRIRSLPPGPVQTALAQSARGVQQFVQAGDTGSAVAALRALVAELQAAEASGPGQAAGPAPLDIWNGAKEGVDTGLTQLQQALRGYGHPALDRIAEFGLAGLSGGGVQTALMASLVTYSRAPGDMGARDAVVEAIAGYRGFLAGNPLVALCDDNPFNVKVELAATLGRALDQIEERLAG
ncbi:MAG: hypothetical protein ACK4L4_10025 [Gemmobacter sp.]